MVSVECAGLRILGALHCLPVDDVDIVLDVYRVMNTSKPAAGSGIAEANISRLGVHIDVGGGARSDFR